MSGQKLILYGAFDRYNYGDILIPLILGKYLKQHGFDEITYCSVKNADLTKFGGFKCKSLTPEILKENNTIMVTGGETLGVDWSSITSYYGNWFMNRCIRFARLIFPRSWINSLCRKMINGHFEYPFLIERHTLNHSDKIIYNAVGGVALQSSNSVIKIMLDSANYVSVRDKHSSQVLYTKWGTKTFLVPDIANSISIFYPNNILLKSINTVTKDFITQNDGNYFCFQIAQQYAKGQLSMIVDSLSEIISMGAPIALLPLGTVSGHEDDKILQKIYAQISSKKVFILRKIHILDSIALIAHSNVFAGTSLHGNITAMSYGIPHFPLNQDVKKLTEYIKQWDIPEVKPCPHYSKIPEYYNRAKIMDKNELLRNRDKLINQIEWNMVTIGAIIVSET